MTTVPTWVVRGVQFTDDGAVLEYMQPAEDLKANGISLTHQLFVPLGDDYDDELEALEDAAQALLKDVLEDLPRLDAFSFDPPDEDEDDDTDND